MPGSTVYAHLDESCSGNQFEDRARPGGAGALVETWRDGEWRRRDLWVSEPDTTNNRMALRSAIETLRHLRGVQTVFLVSDSTYLVSGINEWMPEWKSRGWRRRRGEIRNLPLWRELDRVMARHEVSARWVKGHSGHPENTYADHLSTRAAAAQDSSRGFRGSGFTDWLERGRARGLFDDYLEFLPPQERYPELR